MTKQMTVGDLRLALMKFSAATPVEIHVAAVFARATAVVNAHGTVTVEGVEIGEENDAFQFPESR